MKWDCDKEAYCYIHDHVHAMLEGAFAMVHGVGFANNFVLHHALMGLFPAHQSSQRNGFV